MCSWLLEPQPPEPRTGSPAPWPWARHTEFLPPQKLLWPGTASARPEGTSEGGERWAGSPPSARCLGCAFESLTHCTHAQRAADSHPLGPPHIPALDDAPPQDGEAHCGPSFPGAADRTAGRKRLGVEGMGVGRRVGGHPDEGWRKKCGHWGPGETPI